MAVRVKISTRGTQKYDLNGNQEYDPTQRHGGEHLRCGEQAGAVRERHCGL